MLIFLKKVEKTLHCVRLSLLFHIWRESYHRWMGRDPDIHDENIQTLSLLSLRLVFTFTQFILTDVLIHAFLFLNL